MQPVPEVRAAADTLSALTGELDVLRGLQLLSEVAVALVPSVIGVSLTIVVDDEPITVTATDDATAAVDAVQYLDGGPCLEASADQASVVVDDVLDEGRWQLYRHAASTSGVRSSLSLPLGAAGGRTPGAINLYAAEPDAFKGKEACSPRRSKPLRVSSSPTPTCPSPHARRPGASPSSSRTWGR